MAADDLSHWMAIARRVVVGFAFVVVVVVVCVFFVYSCFLRVKAWWQSPRVRLFRLGGVTTLTRTLNYDCAMCQESMEAGEKVRTLSCDHAFHRGATDGKCEEGVDHWLLTTEAMECPLCRKSPRPVLPWKQPPPSSPAPSPPPSEPALRQLPRTPSTQDLEAPLLPTHGGTPAEASSSSASAPPPEQTQLPRTSSTQDLEKAPLLPAHGGTPAEASLSSASAPPPEQTQLPRTSTPDLAEVSPPPADDEIVPYASSSQ